MVAPNGFPPNQRKGKNSYYSCQRPIWNSWPSCPPAPHSLITLSLTHSLYSYHTAFPRFLQKANHAPAARLGPCCSLGLQNTFLSSSHDSLPHLLHISVGVTSSEMPFPTALCLAAQGPPFLPPPQYSVLLLCFTFLHISSSDVLYIYLFGYLPLHIRI